MAGELLRKDSTMWKLWGEDGKRNRRARGTLNQPDEERRERELEDQHVGHVLGHMKESGRKFAKSPKLRRGETSDACRIYGSLEGNKVQGDFHITARGHGYMEWGAQHLDHEGAYACLLFTRIVILVSLPNRRPALHSLNYITQPYQIDLSETYSDSCSSLQFHPRHHRTFLWSTLSLPPQPP